MTMITGPRTDVKVGVTRTFFLTSSNQRIYRSQSFKILVKIIKDDVIQIFLFV